MPTHAKPAKTARHASIARRKAGLVVSALQKSRSHPSEHETQPFLAHLTVDVSDRPIDEVQESRRRCRKVTRHFHTKARRHQDRNGINRFSAFVLGNRLPVPRLGALVSS